LLENRAVTFCGHTHPVSPNPTLITGIFLLIAMRNPAANRSLIAFTAWSSFAHAVVMSALALQPKQANERAGFLGGSAVLRIALAKSQTAATIAVEPLEARRPRQNAERSRTQQHWIIS